MGSTIDLTTIKKALQKLDRLVKNRKLDGIREKDFESVKFSQEFISSFIKAALDDLNTVSSIEDLKNRPKFIKAVAHIALLTSCPEETKANGSPKDFELDNLHKELSRIFFQLANFRKLSRGHLGRPLLWKRLCPTAKTTGARGLYQSASLWQYSDVCVEIPDRYSDSLLAATMYLVMTDVSNSFRIGDSRPTEIPCLVDLYEISGPNNRKKICSLIEEFHALVHFCLHERYYDPGYSVQSEEIKFDFAIKNQRGRLVRYVSVKSVQFQGRRANTNVSAFVSGQNEANVLLHDCDCPFCHQQPMWKVQINGETIEDDATVPTEEDRCDQLDKLLAEFNCSHKQEFVKILRVARFGTIYLLSAKLLLDLRFVFKEFNHAAYCESSFYLRKHLICAIEAAAASKTKERPSSSRKQMPALIARED